MKALTPQEVAEALSVQTRDVYRLIKRGQLPAINVAAGVVRPRYRIRPEDFKAWQQSRLTQAIQ